MSLLFSLLAAAASVPAGIGKAIAFFKTPLGRGLGAALILASVYGIAFHRGEGRAERACDAAAARAEVAAMKIDRDNQAARADHTTKVLSVLRAMDARNQEEIERLRQEVATLPLQSTKPGAKHDPKALMDDSCNLTERGARGLQ